MSRIAYVNGQYTHHTEAVVPIEDRGYQFADGIYEVIAVQDRRLVDGAWHLQRLERSREALKMPAPVSDNALLHIVHEVLRRNRVRHGAVYIQISRGVAPRDHAFPTGVTPSLICTAKPRKPTPSAAREAGVAVVSVADIRWQRCDIKTTALLANVLAKQTAREQGAFEAWQVNGAGEVTEGSSTNAWIVDRDGSLVTRPAGPDILNGITRLRVLELARQAGISVRERAFTLEEAKLAREAFLTSTTAEIMPVTSIDQKIIANGQPGSVTAALAQRYQEFMLSLSDEQSADH